MICLGRATLVLAVVLLALSNVSVASAQFTNFAVQPLGRITCVATFVPILLRAENLAARTDNSRLDCTNDGVFNPFTPNNLTQYVLMNVNLTLNTAVTNMLPGGDALVVVNDNNAWNPQVGSLLPDDGCGFILGMAGDPFPVPDQRYPCPQKGTITGASTLTWTGIQFPVPGAPNDLGTLPTLDGNGIPICDDFFDQVSTDSCFDLTTTMRFTNVRGNAAALGAGGTIIATLGVTSFASISMVNNQGALGMILQGLLTSVVGDGVFQCTVGTNVVSVTLAEGFAAAFKVLGSPGFANGDNATENGYPLLTANSPAAPPQPVGATGGGASQGTRFRIGFADVPPGVTLTMPNLLDETGPVTVCTPGATVFCQPSGPPGQCADRSGGGFRGRVDGSLGNGTKPVHGCCGPVPTRLLLLD